MSGSTSKREHAQEGARAVCVYSFSPFLSQGVLSLYVLCCLCTQRILTPRIHQGVLYPWLI